MASSTNVAYTNKYVFIVNPKAGANTAKIKFEKSSGLLKELFPESVVVYTEYANHATVIARAAVAAQALAVVAVGGDGTNNEVINGFFDENHQRIVSPTYLAIATSGTGGDFRRTFGWSTDIDTELKRLSTAKPQTIDVGRLQSTWHDGSTRTRHYLNISGFGVPGRVVDLVNRSSKRLGAKATFFIASLRALVGFGTVPVQISEDGGPWRNINTTLTVAANAKYFGGSMYIAPEAKPDDGLLSMVSVSSENFWFWLFNNGKFYDGRHMQLANVSKSVCRSFDAKPADGWATPILIDIDGEEGGRLPARFEIVPASVTILV